MSSKSSSTTRRRSTGAAKAAAGRPVLRRATIVTESGEALTDLPPEALAQLEGQVLGVLEHNGDLQEEWARPQQVQQALQEAAEQELLLDPEAMFGRPAGDPLDPQGTLDGPADGWGSGEPTKAAGSTGSSPAAAGAENPLQARAKAKAFAQLAAAGFAAVSGLLNHRLRLDEDDETWLADKEDLDGVGKPAGRIIARHAPLPGGADTNDLSDAIEMAIAGAGYLIKNATARARELRARRRAQTPVYQEA